MQGMEGMLLLAVPLEDQDAVQAATEDLLIPVCPICLHNTVGTSADR